MQDYRVLRIFSFAKSPRHGCCNSGKERRLGFRTLVLFLGFLVATFAFGLQDARSELRFYISDGSNRNLTIIDNGVGDDDLDVDEISVSFSALNQTFSSDWLFTKATALSTLGVNNEDLPVRLLNIQFDATNQSNSVQSIQFQALYTGALGLNQNPTNMLIYGTGTTTQPLLPDLTTPPLLDIRVAGAFNNDENASYQTNGYNDLTGPPLWVAASKDGDINASSYVNEEYVWGFNDENAEVAPAADGLFSLTLSAFAGAMQSGDRFGGQLGLEITLPEPISLLSWGGIGLAALWTSRRRRMR